MSLQNIGKHDEDGRLLQPRYKDGRTKQSFKDETDINKILMRAEKSGTISHLNKYQGQYADFSEFDYQENLIQLTRGREMFDELPAEIRSEFQNSPAQFFNYVNDPENKERLEELLPGLAAPGRQMLNVAPPTADKVAADAAKNDPDLSPSGSEKAAPVASEEAPGAEKPTESAESS